MADNPRTKNTTDLQSPATASPGDHATATACRSGMMGCGMGKKGIKGLLLMAACCGAPLLLILVLPVVGSALGGLGVSALNVLALLACPVGMALMMWMMMRGQQTAPQQAAPEQPALPQRVSTAPAAPQEGTILADLTDIAEAGDATVTPPSHTPEQVVTLSQRANGHQRARQPQAGNGRQATAQPVEKNGIQAVALPQSNL